MKALLLVLLLVPQLAAARVYMCVDPDSGRKVFTDRGCDQLSVREEVRIDPPNVNSGRRTTVDSPEKTWRKDLDTRRSGRDYVAGNKPVRPGT